MGKKIIYLLLPILLLIVVPNMTPSVSCLVGMDRYTPFTACIKYNECGTQKDMLTILKNHSIDMVRIRLFFAPGTNDNSTAINLLSGNWGNVEMTKGLTSFGGTACP